MEKDNDYKYDKLPTEPDAAKKSGKSTWKSYLTET